MRMDENRLVRVVMLVALAMGSKVRWVKNLKQSIEEIGWMDGCWSRGTGKGV